MRLPVIYMRGGTSKGLFFHEKDLPNPGSLRDDVLLRAMGSPDPYRRQLNGMGGGISSLSKIIVVRRSDRPDADIEFLHGQVAVDRPLIDYSANCGNLSAAVGPFAIDEGLITTTQNSENVAVRILNLNSGILVHAQVPVSNGRYDPSGDFTMPGVSGTSSRIALQYLRPGASGSGTLFPTGAQSDTLNADRGQFVVSLVVATLPVIWVTAESVGLDPAIMPDELDRDADMMELLEYLRRAGAVRMGLAVSPDLVSEASPKIGLIGPPRDYTALDGEQIRASNFDIMVRMISMGRAHKASPLTGAMCLAAACLARGPVTNSVCRALAGPDVRIGTPSGVLTVGAELDTAEALPGIERTMVYSTARRLMDGWVNAD
jgi:2-methylaconitate cis-trans-isomerase PrpF